MAVQGGVKLVAWSVYNCDWPTQGSKSLYLSASIPASGSLPIDLEIEFETGVLDFVQTVYIDNGLNAAQNVSLTNSISQQKITCPSASQGYFTVLAPPKSKWLLTAGAAIIVPLAFLNFPAGTAVWKVA